MARRIVSLVTALVLTTALAACDSGSGHVSSAGPAASSASWGDPSSADPSSADPSSGSPSAPPSAPAGPTTPAKPPATTPPPKPPAQTGDWAAAVAVLDQINGWRAAAGLRPYTMSTGLVASAHKHNLVMVAGCGLSHRCPGEPDLGARIRAQGVRWSSAGENIGESGPNANTTAAITRAAKGLDTSMFKEQPPDDGHRRNLLSKGFTHIGIDVVRDSHGTVWLTEDFSS
jgi:uncharacterized protein YkwD